MLVDREEHIIGVLVSRPADSPDHEPWEATIEEALRALDQARDDINWGSKFALPCPPGSHGVNRRGDYYTSSEGPSYGGGQKVSDVHNFYLLKILIEYCHL